jgi:hypothetical protein
VKEPERLLAGDATALERKLLLAMADERPSPELSARMASGLSPAVGALGKSAGLAALGKGSALLALALGAGAAAIVSFAPTPTTSRAPAASAREPRVSAPSLQPASAEAEARGAAAASTASTGEDQAAVRAAPAEVRRRATGDIAAEIRLIDTAKRQLHRGAPVEAMAVLDDYRTRFPSGALGQEAAVLRIEALERSGQHGSAQALARRFLRNHPSSTYVGRVSRLVGGLDTEQPKPGEGPQ